MESKLRLLLLLVIFLATPASGPLSAGVLLYVTEATSTNQGRLVTYDVSLESSAAIAASRSVLVDNLQSAWDLAYHSDHLYVANLSGGSVLKYDLSGNLISQLTVVSPVGLAFDVAGNLHVASLASGNNAIYKYDSSGNLISTITNGVNGPRGLGFDSSGNLYVAQYSGGNVTKYDSSGDLISTIGVPNNPYGLAVDTSDNVYVSRFNGPDVQKYDSSGTLLSTISGFNKPAGLVFDSAGNLFVADYGTSTAGTRSISKYDSSGNLVYQWSAVGQPRFMTFASTGGAPASVPEPSTLILGGIAPVMLSFARRFKRKHGRKE